MTEEELQAIRTIMREEISASEQRTRLVIREEIGASEQRTSLVIHEEIGASEQRTGERLDRLEGRVARMDGRIDQLDNTQRSLHNETILLKAEVRTKLINFTTDTREEIRLFKTDVRKDLEMFKVEVRGEMATLKTEVRGELLTFKADLQKEQTQIVSMLDDITQVINDMRADQHNLENKLDDNTLATRRDIRALEGTMQEIKDDTRRFTREFVEMNQLTHARLSYHENTPIGETHPRPPQPGTAA